MLNFRYSRSAKTGEAGTTSPSPPPLQFGAQPGETFARRRRRVLTVVATVGLLVICTDHFLRRGGGPARMEIPLVVAASPSSGQVGGSQTGDIPAVGGEVVPAAPDSWERKREAARALWNADQENLFAAIRDNTVFRPVEAEGWFRLLAILRETDDDQLSTLGLPLDDTLQLLKQPNDYRGAVVHVSGQARRASRVSAPENELGITHYFQVWVDVAGSPVVAYLLDLPEEFPRGHEISEGVSLHGFFFKKWAYQAVDDIRVAPLVLARSLDWSPSHAPPDQPMANGISSTIFFALGATLLALVCWYYLQARTNPRSSLPHVPPKDWSFLANSPKGEPDKKSPPVD